MASNINFQDINELFPVAGQDNDSQGFRDNFNLIKDGLEVAKTEISSLQTTTAQGVAYDSETNVNDFNGNIIQEARFLKTTEDVHVYDVIEAGQTITFDNGHYQIITLGADVTLTLTGWPATNRLARMRLVLLTDDGAGKTVTWSVSGGGVIKTNSSWPGTFTVTSQTDPIIVDFWSSNSGQTVYGQYHGVFD